VLASAEPVATLVAALESGTTTEASLSAVASPSASAKNQSGSRHG